MRTRVDNFLSTLFGDTGGFVQVVIAQPSILSQEKAHGLGRMDTMLASGNSRNRAHTDAQHQTAVMEVVALHVFDGQFKQGYSVSSMFLAKWVGVAQKTAWKIGHAIFELMDPGAESQPPLHGIVKLDEKYFGGKPRYEKSVKYKRGKGNEKKPVLVAVQRQSAVRLALVYDNSAAELCPCVERFAQKQTYLMKDENRACLQIGKHYAAHSWVNHGEKEFARGDVRNNMHIPRDSGRRFRMKPATHSD
jgi:ISXO2-like transposase domain